jgi:hypothetical protein
MHKWLVLVAATLLPLPVVATQLAISVVIPPLKVAEYHRPYVAVWIERQDHSVAANLALWYDVRKADNEGTKWLKDLRQWWRRSGRDIPMPVDGVSGATRPAGQHRLNLAAGKPPLGDLPPGRYELIVEAAREVGGREVLRLPFAWPTDSRAPLSVQGKDELGLVTLDIIP